MLAKLVLEINKVRQRQPVFSRNAVSWHFIWSVPWLDGTLMVLVPMSGVGKGYCIDPELNPGHPRGKNLLNTQPQSQMHGMSSFWAEEFWIRQLSIRRTFDKAVTTIDIKNQILMTRTRTHVRRHSSHASVRLSSLPLTRASSPASALFSLTTRKKIEICRLYF